MSAPWKFRGGAAASMAPITAIEFDPKVELLWVGDSYGTLTSFKVQPRGETTDWSVYSSFSASNRPAGGIFFLNIGVDGMVTVADREGVRGFKRGGFPLMYIPLPPDTQNYIDLFHANNKTGTMFFTGNVGLTKLEIHDGETDHHTVPTTDGLASSVVALRQSDSWVVTGSTSGSVVVRSSSDLSVIGAVTPSRNRVMAVDVFDNTVVAAFSERSATSVVKVYDVRKLDGKAFTVSDIPSGNVTQLRRYEDSFGLSRDRAFVLTAQGFHVIQFDQEKPVYSSRGAVEGSCTSVTVSQSSMCAAIGNDKGSFVALAHPATHDDYIMSTYKQPERPVPPSFSQNWVETSVSNGFDETIAASSLVSSWPEEEYMILSVHPKLRCANVESDSIVSNQWGLVRADSYLTDPKDKLASVLPNPYPFNTQLGSDPARVPELLQELRKDMKRKHKVSRGGNTECDPMDDALQVCYGMQHRIEWRSYNELPQKVVGIDNSFPECWITPLLQSLYLCQPPEYPIRKVIVRHLCTREFCMTCEIAFIFSNMMITAASNGGMREAALPPIVQVGNLIRTMKQIRTFTSSEVFAKPKSRDDAVAKMHLAQRLLLEMLHKDLLDQKAYPFLGYKPPAPDYENTIAALFGTEFTSNGHVHVEPRFFWEVPASALKVDEGLQHLLKQLEAYKDQVQIKRLPPIIVLLLNPEHGNLKPPTSLKISRAGKEDYNYVLNSNIVHLADDVEDAGNFVSHQRIKEDTFCLVNDYRVTVPMKMLELERLIPALRSYSAVVTFYALDQLVAPPYARSEETRPPNMWSTLGPLLTNDVLSRPLLRDPARQVFRSPLKDYTEIKADDLVAIDAEYVVLKWDSRGADTGFYSPQKRSHMGLARVSCILSTQEGDERTIVDDYVHIPEEIDDYVTQFSGIHPGDLDPLQSTKSLTSFKSTYLKLRALVDAGVVFVGHGLSQDFRVCNIAVPKRQIIDTLDIFHVKGGRFLSLRFLAYHVLGESVQEDEHDSIEDARTSLRLYRKYVQLKKESVFESVLDHLMAKGAETSWYVPDRSSAFRGEPMTPPASLMGSPVFKHDDADSEAILHEEEEDDEDEDDDVDDDNVDDDDDDDDDEDDADVTAAEADAEDAKDLFEAVRKSIEEEDEGKPK